MGVEARGQIYMVGAMKQEMRRVEDGNALQVELEKYGLRGGEKVEIEVVPRPTRVVELGSVDVKEKDIYADF